MICLTKLGNYLGRTIEIADWSGTEQVHSGVLESSVLLLVLGIDMPLETLRAFVKMLIGQQPLAIMLFGTGARAAFDLVIAELNDGVRRKHVMTRLSEEDGIEDAIAELLQSMWPSEDRFDEWKGYAVINVGGDITRIERAVKKLSN